MSDSAGRSEYSRAMTNLEAVREVVRVLMRFEDDLRHGTTESELEELLRDKSIEWTLHEELRGIATVLIRAWVERAPESAAARHLLEEHLAGLGKHRESRNVAAGGAPEPLDVDQEKLRAFFEAVASSQRD
jgi:hypothetical protein